MPEGPAFDPEAFRNFEHEGWNRLYLGYHNHWEHLTTQAIPQMLDGTGVTTGMDVLDVASGPGYVSGAASARGNKTIDLDLSEKMAELAALQPGFLGLESAADDVNVTVSYWADLESIKNWKANLEHQEAQKLGREKWYSHYKTRRARCELDYVN